MHKTTPQNREGRELEKDFIHKLELEKHKG